MKELHCNQRVVATDVYFVCGGNPEKNSGGGVIGSRKTWADAITLKLEAIKRGYRHVQIFTWNEMMEDSREIHSA